MTATKTLELPAVEVSQGAGRTLYSFAIDGKQLPSFAAISRIGRADGLAVDGYQRTEVLSHIGEIKKYLESENPMIPNAIVLAFDHRVEFVPSAGKQSPPSRLGHIRIPIDSRWTEVDKPA